MKQVQEKHSLVEHKEKIVQGICEQKKAKSKMIIHLNKLQEKKAWKSPSTERTSYDKRVKKTQEKDSKFNEEEDEESKIRGSKTEHYTRLIEMSDQHKMIDKKINKHKYHPASKIIMPQTENNNSNNRNDFLGLQAYIVDYKFLKRKNDDVNLYHLGIHSPFGLKNSTSFAKFYSGGPDQREELFNVHKMSFSISIKISS